jgi:DnaJ-class molecular chaperone
MPGKESHKKSQRYNLPVEEFNYYDILNLPSSCSKDEIDKAYRALAMKWHPDKHGGDKSDAEKKFKEISKAYQVLSNEETRKNYDAHGITIKTENLIDPSILFNNLFEDEDNKIPDVIVYVESSIDKLHSGFTESVSFKRFSPCVKCDCTGTRDKIDGSCVPCKGRGIILESIKGGKMGFMMHEKQCEVCEGKGIDPNIKKCKKCDGYKYIKEDIECEVDIPRGAYDNYFIKLEHEGNYIPEEEIQGRDKDKDNNKEKKKEKNKDKNTNRTDVIVVVKEKDSEKSIIRRGMFIKEINRFNRADLLITLDITFGESIAGIKKEIDIFGESVGIEIENPIQNGDIHVIKNMGMWLVPEECEKIHVDEARGDLFIVFNVIRPELTKQQQTRLWQIISGTAYPEYDDVDKIYESFTFDQYIHEHMKIKSQNKNEDEDKDKDSDSEKSNSESESDKESDKESENSNSESDKDSESESGSDKGSGSESESDKDSDENFDDLINDTSDDDKKHSKSKKR